MAEKEYIEREAALKEFEKVCNVCMALVNKPMCGDCSVADTVRKVKSIPAADVRPVRHGRWAITADEWLQHCSICGQRRPIVAGDYKWNYCPNCGALMDKDGDGE